MDQVLIVSADGHVGPQEEEYRPFLERRHHDVFDEYLRIRRPTTLADLNTPESLRRHEARWVETGKHVSMGDPHRRIEVLEAEGAVAEILFPDRTRNDEIPFSAAPGPGAPPPLRWAGEQAYNRWLAAFCSAHPGRFGGLVAVQSYLDVPGAVAEIRWAAEQPGIRGVMLPGVEPDGGSWLDEENEAIWHACADSGLAVHFHVGAGAPPPGGQHYPATVEGGMIATFEGWFWTQRALWWLIYGGVLERHPTLRVVFTETGSAWVADRLASMDWFYDVPYKLESLNRVMPRRPTEYFRRQCAIGSSILSRVDIERRGEIGIGNMMFGLDVPHFEGTGDMTLPYLQRTFGAAGVAEADARAILGLNAVRFYGFDLDELTAVASRVGPSITDVLDAQEDDGDPDFHWIRRPA